MDLSRFDQLSLCACQVSLREEGVDLSLPPMTSYQVCAVSLREEGVDLSNQISEKVLHFSCLPPRGGSGFKPEIALHTGADRSVSLREEGVDLSNASPSTRGFRPTVSLRVEGVDLSRIIPAHAGTTRYFSPFLKAECGFHFKYIELIAEAGTRLHTSGSCLL